MTLTFEMLETLYPEEHKRVMDMAENDFKDKNEPARPEYIDLYKLLSPVDLTATYYVTDTVIEKLDMLHVKKKKTTYPRIVLDKGETFTGSNGSVAYAFNDAPAVDLAERSEEMFDWTVFKNLKNQKSTFYMNNGDCLRMVVSEGTLWFCYMKMDIDHSKENFGHLYWTMFYVDRATGEQCDHFKHEDVLTREVFVYKLLCFMFLTDNDEVIVPPGTKYGTKKEGKVINTLKVPITIVNSRWNTTVIRTEKFGVRGHFALRWAGQGHTLAKIVFIEPYEKKGYIRKSPSLEL